MVTPFDIALALTVPILFNLQWFRPIRAIFPPLRSKTDVTSI